MGNALTPPCAVAAVLLAVAGMGKLRSPQTAAGALGWPSALVRAFALGELALAAWTLATATPAAEAVMAGVYAAFAAVGVALWRRGRACGCFGADSGPASPVQTALSCVLSGVSAGGWLAGAHPAGWMLSRAPGVAAVLSLGVVGSAYAAVLVYAQMPALWRSGSGR